LSKIAPNPQLLADATAEKREILLQRIRLCVNKLFEDEIVPIGTTSITLHLNQGKLEHLGKIGFEGRVRP
jgi:hypothetical protein